jgi:hypothetical protein
MRTSTASSWTSRFLFLPAVISTIAGVTTLTNWGNIAHHSTADGWRFLVNAAIWTVIAVYFRRHNG